MRTSKQSRSLSQTQFAVYLEEMSFQKQAYSNTLKILPAKKNKKTKKQKKKTKKKTENFQIKKTKNDSFHISAQAYNYKI